MIEPSTALKLIKELSEEVSEKGGPLWAWIAVHDLACHALGLSEPSEESMQWAISKAKELDSTTSSNGEGT